MKNRFTKSQIVLLSVLAALIVIVIGVGAFLIIRNVSAANEEAAKLSSGTSSAVSETSDSKSESKSKTSQNKKTKSEKTSSSSSKTKSSKASTTSSKASTTSSKVTSSATSSKTSSKTSSSTSSKTTVKGDKVKRVKPKENTSHASEDVLKVNGKSCHVGDTITVVLNITSQKSVVNYQGTTKFDKEYLELKEVKSNSFGVANAEATEILYNASTINGMNFSETGTVYTATFKVLKKGSTKVKNDLEIISELVGSNIVQLGETDYKAQLDIYD